MALNIKDEEADRLARELAAATGQGITVAAKRAFEERLQRVRARTAAAKGGDDLDEVIARGRARATLDVRDIDAIVGYDEDGLPR